MSKPIQEQSFWDKRIEEALSVNQLRLSVFRTSEDKWRDINIDHKRILERNLSSGDAVLDAGCAYGRLSEFMPQDVDYTGVDQCQQFIQMAKDLYPSNNFHTGDLCNLDFDDNQFDWAVCVSVMNMVIGNIGMGKWEEIQSELLRGSRNGILSLEYTESDILVLISRG